MRNQNLQINKLKIAIFDWDNTLAETRTPLIYAVNQVLEEYGLPEWKEVKKLRDNNLSFRDNFPRIFGDKYQEAYQKYYEIYLKNVSTLISTFEGTHEVLEYFRDHGVIRIIMSNKDRRLLEFELPLLFNPDLFDKVVCGHEAKRDKPYPEHIWYSVEDYMKPEEINQQNVWIIGDSPQDSVCGCRANALPIRIGYPIWGEEEEHAENIIHYDTFCDFFRELKEANA